MSKYDFEIDLSQNSSTGIILNHINKGSVVLEFGCATGRMTRYMKEVLDCQVYIVEYDEYAYNMALQYAEDGLCDDIMNFRWTEKFGGVAFDVILFTDVLEHLSAPGKVLRQAAGMLKESGCLYASIPNIAHNDILLKAYDGHFDYTSTGLLDDTHIRFWGINNIEMLAAECGLNIRRIESTWCPTGCTEQFAQTSSAKNRLLQNMLLERPFGEVYQLIISLDKNKTPSGAPIIKIPSITSHIYLDTGSGFNADEHIAFDSVYSGHGSYIAHYVINDPVKVRSIRLDPVEDQECILANITIRQRDRELRLIFQNAIAMGSGFLLQGNDPMVCADVLLHDQPIIVDAEICILGDAYIQMVQKALIDRSAALERLTAENEALCTDLGAYIVLANNKDKRILELEHAVEYYRSFAVVKLWAFLAEFIRGTKRWIRRIIGKEDS